MSDEVNVEAIAASVATELTKEFLASVASGLKGIPKNLFERYRPNFEGHLAEMYKRNYCVRTLCSKDKSVEFTTIYVEAKFRSESEEYSDSQIIEAVHANKRCVISANGGAGKTFLMRHLWLETFAKPSGRVPIFVELRQLNGHSSLNIESFIRNSAFGIDTFSQENFLKFCKKGVFIFILDGFDEVVQEKRRDLEQQIIQLAQEYPECGIIVSGRPDDRFGSWQSFQTFRAEPFSFKQYRELIQKVPFHEQTKRNFLKVSDEKFFNKHESFLSNPLLAIMMLMTFRDNAEIPSRLNTFYENCFNTLYSQHDALKESYFREKNLDQDTFRRVFSVFCLFTYIKNKFTLDEAEFRSFIEKAAKHLELSETVDEISEDFLVSVNLIIKEGMNYSFIHRSFQEYFAAFCATSIMVNMTPEMLQLFASNRYDSTFKLAYEIHPNLVQEKYLLPRFKVLSEEGRFVSAYRPSKPYSAINISGLNFRWEVAHFLRKVKNKDRSLLHLTSYRWAFDSDFSAFLHAASSAFPFLEDEILRLNAEMNEMLDFLLTLFDISQPDLLAITSEVKVSFALIYNDVAPQLNTVFSKPYKKSPNGTAALNDKIVSRFAEYGAKLEKRLISIMRGVDKSMEQLEKDFDYQKASIESLLDL
ncbi:NACHT domain-containing protein [Profundibacter sp.]